MTVLDVKASLEEIESCSGDSEEAHFLERTLWFEVLTAISLDSSIMSNARDLAKTALKSQEIEFSRWFS